MAIKNSRRAPARQEQIRLNLGCGSNLLPGFINVDLYVDHESNGIAFQKADIRKLPFPSDYADYALVDNVLEHLRMADVPLALFEIRRVLKPGGRCVAMVPDFGFIAKQFQAMGNGSFNAVIYHWFAELAYGTQIAEGEFHKTPMTPEYLNFLLHMAGFANFELLLFPMGAPLPDPDKYPGITRGAQESNRFRNDNILADIRK